MTTSLILYHCSALPLSVSVVFTSGRGEWKHRYQGAFAGVFRLLEHLGCLSDHKNVLTCGVWNPKAHRRVHRSTNSSTSTVPRGLSNLRATAHSAPLHGASATRCDFSSSMYFIEPRNLNAKRRTNTRITRLTSPQMRQHHTVLRLYFRLWPSSVTSTT